MALPPIKIDPERFLKQEFRLQPLPLVATKVIDSISKESTSGSQVADLISSDAALSAELLRRVNSASYGLAREIKDIRVAVSFLGLARLQRLAMTSYVMKAVSPASRSERERFWFHSYYTALMSKWVAKRLAGRVDPDELYAAALLHDIGKPIYLMLFPAHYREMASRVERDGRFFTEAERHFDWPSHLTVGSLVCQYWGLPDSVREACEVHELEQLQTGQALSDTQRVVCVANLLVHLGEEWLDKTVEQEVRETVQTTLDCSDEDWPDVMSHVHECKTEVQGFLEKMKPHIAAAEEHHVMIGIENHGNNLIDSPDAVKWLAEFAASSALGIALAPYHLEQDASLITQLIRDLSERMVMFYAWQHGQGASKRLPKAEELEQLPGRGYLDFAPMVAALKNTSYSGFVSIFMHPVPRGIAILESTAAVTREINRARGYLESLA